jgi:hypothetical protein
LIVGAFRRWRWLVDPRIAMVPQTYLRRFRGPRSVAIYVCSIGVAMLALALWGSWSVCCAR